MYWYVAPPWSNPILHGQNLPEVRRIEKTWWLFFSTVQKKQDLPYTNRNRIKLNGLVLLKNLNWKPSKFSHIFCLGLSGENFPNTSDLLAGLHLGLLDPGCLASPLIRFLTVLYDDLDIYIYDGSSLRLVISFFFPSYDQNGALKIVIYIYIYIYLFIYDYFGDGYFLRWIPPQKK